MSIHHLLTLVQMNVLLI
uniref:Uncharacterized protein n=1 Tax=Anguilla anguilla TaxID=7936 RepID=A0A0E9PHM6_ANGAN